MKVKGPLQSFEASGSISGVLTFSKRKSGQQCRFQNKQKDVITPDRTTQRDKYRVCVNTYRGFSEVSKTAAEQEAVGRNYTGFNYFMRECLLGNETGEDLSIYGNRVYGVCQYGKVI